MRFSDVFGLFFSGDFGFSTAYRNPHLDTLFYINFFLNVGEGAPVVTSGPLSATFPTLWLKSLAT